MTQMSQEDAARIQSTQAREGQDTSAGSFPARAQSAADRHANEEAQAMGHGSGSDEGGRSDGGGGSDSGGGGGRRGGGRGRRGWRGGGGGGGAGVLNSMVPDVGGGVMVITKEEASHIKSVEMREGFDTGRGSLAARAQAAADRYEAAHHSGGGGGGGGGRRGGRGGGGQGGVGNVDFPHMTKEEASLIQSIEAREGHDTGHGTLSALAQSAADRHANEGQRENI